MKRGEIWTVSGGAPYARKPRPAVILQDDRFSETQSVTLCPMTSHPTRKHGIRILVFPSEINGLDQSSYIQVDKISTVPRERLGNLVGTLDDSTLDDLSRAAAVFLGI